MHIIHVQIVLQPYSVCPVFMLSWANSYLAFLAYGQYWYKVGGWSWDVISLCDMTLTSLSLLSLNLKPNASFPEFFLLKPLSFEQYLGYRLVFKNPDSLSLRWHQTL